MKASQLPTRVPLPFADSGSKNTIPEASQIGITPGAASLTDGFPPLTFTPLSAGGVPPSGKDFNGILNLLSQSTRWQNAGSFFPYDSAFSSDIGGYPKGAILQNVSGDGFWLSTTDDNTADPDTDTSGAWVPIFSQGIASVALSGSNVTLANAQYSLRVVTFTGALTANVQVTFPTLAGVRWLIVNQTTNAYTLTCKTASGSGVVLDQGNVQEIYCDGTNISLASASAGGNSDQTFKVANAASSDEAVNLGQLAEKASISGDSTQTFEVAAATQVSDAVNLGQFQLNSGTNGYQKLPSGLIIQWGTTPNFNSESGQTITLPIAFPNNIFNATATLKNTGSPSQNCNQLAQVYSLSKTSIGVFLQAVSSSSTWPVDATWIAIGN